jgi:uncharacterized protein YlxP (DUF503 family)
VSAARVALGLVELHLPDVASLKEKRHVLKGLKEKVRARFEVSSPTFPPTHDTPTR